ncbi:MAG: glycosyltransferase family A protein, partial [Planctomycetota bacterium]
RGDFYAMQDADDVSAPNRIERQVAALLDNEQLAGVFCGYDLLIGQGPGARHTAPTFAARSPEQCSAVIDAYRMPGHDPTAMWRVSAVQGLRFDETLRVGQGFDYVLQVGERHRDGLAVVGETLYGYRIHGRGVTRTSPNRRLAFVREVRRRAMLRRGHDPAEVEEVIAGLTAISGQRRWGRWRSGDRNNHLINRFVESVRCQKAAGKWSAAARTAVEALTLGPLSLTNYKALAALLLPRRSAT